MVSFDETDNSPYDFEWLTEAFRNFCESPLNDRFNKNF